MDRRMDKEDVTYITEYYSAIKKNKIMPFAVTQMDLEIIILSEVNQTEEDKYHIISLIWDNYGKNGLIYKTETDSLTQKTSMTTTWDR